VTYYAYVTQVCSADGQRHGKTDELSKLAEKIEFDQSIASWDKFLPSPYIKKSLGKFRVMAERHPLDEDIVICFLALMSRGDGKYERFIQHFTGLPSSPGSAALRNWLKTRAAHVPTGLPKPTGEELGYLYRAHAEVQDELIYETNEWVERIEKLQNVLPFIKDLLDNKVLIDGPANETIVRNANATILFRRFPDERKTFLIAPLVSSTLSDEAGLRERYRSVLGDGAVNDDLLRKQSRRAFPAVLAADLELWAAVQKDSAANLALSPEEMDVLSSILTPSASGPLYPLFINGRPGSGKSTILQYIFAEQLRFHLALPLESRASNCPLYLTYSERLHALAKNNVRRLLKYNAELLLRGSSGDVSKDPQFESAFALFQDFVRSLLPAERAREYLPAQRIGFSRFRTEWTARARTERGARALTADLAWHVIRTFIKGMRNDGGDHFDLESYQELPSKRRTVTVDTYARVYEEVWRGWYRALCRDQGLWDDQDLAREALDTSSSKGRHPAIFCDEAQDFTRVELELILRLSLFAERSVEKQELRRIPFAFAGDPFQTLNPTGFQWASVSAGFHEQIVQELDPDGRAKLTFNQRELSFNYRSSSKIVGFCNSLQLLRSILFDIPGIKPQQTWSDRDSILPEVFRVDDPDVLKELSAQEELVVIIPCQEGAEQDYIQNDEHLKSLRDRSGSRNFLSPLSAKGLEFSRVVLYKFGEECLREYPRLLEPLRSGQIHADPESALPLEYFMNRLYVASSRPKNRLFIVDTQAGIAHLWHSQDLRDMHGMVRRLPAAEVSLWDPADLAWTQPGAGKIGSDDADSPLALAEQFEEQGIGTADTYLLELAEANYRRGGNVSRAAVCRATRLELAGEYGQAGEIYLSNGRPDSALRCLWRARRYPDVAKMPESATRLEGRAARFMAGPKSVADLVGFLNFLTDELHGSRRDLLVSDAGMSEVVDSLASAIAKHATSIDDLPDVFQRLRGLKAVGLGSDEAPMAQIGLEAGDAKYALEIYDRIEKGNSTSEEHRRAKAEGLLYPENVRALHELGRHEEIVKLATASTRHLEESDIQAVTDAFLHAQQWDSAMHFAERQPHAQKMLQILLDQSRTSADKHLRFRIAAAVLRQVIQDKNWKEATKLVQTFKKEEPTDRPLRRFLILAAASSESLTPKTARDEREALFTYIQTDALGETDWEPSLMRPIGAVIERAGKIIDSLTYYEEIWQRIRSVENRSDIEYAEQRWCKCKYRQAEHSEGQKRVDQARQQRAEADSRALHLQIRVLELPNYPPIPAPTLVSLDFMPVTEEPAEITDDDQRQLILLAARQGFSSESVSRAMKLPLNVVEEVVKHRAATSG
jgi:hypothetical protein